MTRSGGASNLPARHAAKGALPGLLQDLQNLFGTGDRSRIGFYHHALHSCRRNGSEVLAAHANSNRVLLRKGRVLRVHAQYSLGSMMTQRWLSQTA